MSHNPVRSVDHIALAVRSIADASVLFRDVFGGSFVTGGDDEKLQLRSIQYTLPPGIKIELLQPLSAESQLAGFLDKHGEGFHHVTLFFDDIEGLIPDLSAAGFEVTDTDLQDEGWRETYLRPRSGFGALFQLVDTTKNWSVPHPDVSEEDVIAGRVRWDGTTPVLKEKSR